MVYIENRSFLPNDHSLRNDVQRFPCRVGENKPCTSSKPISSAYKELVEKHTIYDQAKSNTERAFLAKSYGCKGRYAFMRLPNHDCTTLVHPDAMHTITNVVTTLVGLLSGNANISQVLLEEEEFGRREWYRDVQTVKGMDKHICRIFKLFKFGFHLYFAGNSLFSSEIILICSADEHLGCLIFYLFIFKDGFMLFSCI